MRPKTNAQPKLKLKLPRNRIWELDYFRGILLILVTIDHCCIFTPMFVSPTNGAGVFLLKLFSDYMSLPPRPYIQPVIIFIFAFLSGINCSFTKNAYKRATGFGLFVSAFMLLHRIGIEVFPGFLSGLLIFNILAVLSISMFVWLLLVSLKTPKWLIAVLGAVVAAVGLYFWAYAIKNGGNIVLPENLKCFALLIYSSQGLSWSINNFEPLLPSLGFFLCGGVLGGLVYKQKKSLFRHLPNDFIKPVIAFGRNSLFAYLFAPVIIIAFFMLLNGMHII